MPDFLKTESGRLLAMVAGGALLFFILTRKGVAGSIAKEIVGGAANAVVDAGAGAVVGIGSAFGVPETDADQCTIDIANGETFAASKSCPAGRFLSWSVMGNEDEKAAALVAARNGRSYGTINARDRN